MAKGKKYRNADGSCKFGKVKVGRRKGNCRKAKPAKKSRRRR